MMVKNAKTVDEYFEAQPVEIRPVLEKFRQIIKKASPKAEELISYQMPAYKQNGILVYFGAFKEHIGFFPTPSGVEAFRHELTEYKISKGTIQFPYSKSLPVALITKIVKYRVMENDEELRLKKRK